jgi:hypothetical protein
MTNLLGKPDRCTVPPRGWRCTRVAGHPGPCAAIEEDDDLDPGYTLPTEAPLWAKVVLIGAAMVAMMLVGWAIAQVVR